MSDIYGRVRLLERKLNWLMSNMRMKAVVSSGVVGPDGRAVAAKVFEGTLHELFALSKELPSRTEAEGDEAPPFEEDEQVIDAEVVTNG